MATSRAYCQTHSHKIPQAFKAQNKALRDSYDPKLPLLNRGQGGPWRHACPYCIYDRAYNDGYKAGQVAARKSGAQ